MRRSRRSGVIIEAPSGGLEHASDGDVSGVRINLPYPGTSIRLTQPAYGTDARLLVGSQLLGGHRPTWSTSDTTRAVIAMRDGPSFDPTPRAVILPRGVGQVSIVARWGTLRDSVQLTITP